MFVLYDRGISYLVFSTFSVFVHCLLFIVAVDGIYKDSNAAPGHTQPSLIVVMMNNKKIFRGIYTDQPHQQKLFQIPKFYTHLRHFQTNGIFFHIVWKCNQIFCEETFPENLNNSVFLTEKKNLTKNVLPGI